MTADSGPSSQTILVVDDDQSLRDLLFLGLEAGGYDVREAEDGYAALDQVAAGGIDMVILDVLMPGLDGRQVCRALRARGDRVPVMLLSALDDVGDRVDGLDAGAQDYMTKPYALDELLARVRARLRSLAGSGPAPLRHAGVTVDVAGRCAFAGAREVALTRTEFDALAILVEAGDRVVAVDDLHDRLYGPGRERRSNVLQVLLSSLRRKLERPGEPQRLVNVPQAGYVLRAA